LSQRSRASGRERDGRVTLLMHLDADLTGLPRRARVGKVSAQPRRLGQIAIIAPISGDQNEVEKMNLNLNDLIKSSGKETVNFTKKNAMK